MRENKLNTLLTRVLRLKEEMEMNAPTLIIDLEMKLIREALDDLEKEQYNISALRAMLLK